ncbi:hypothetical protein WHR41_01022 [Cladosporium halotolerans]|uniref:Uncharacterized protein n=1 Tax=Cladosporium halotolerans TaxID=1052096 RepID=A0AB34KZF4_9PEZI
MANRIPHDRLLPGGGLDPAIYTPVFLHDTLMLPGSLASLLGKDSPLDILDRLTPARLPSFTIVTPADPPHVACLLPMSVPSTVTGLLFFGTGRDARKLIKNHYRPFAKRTCRNVVIEVKVPVNANSGSVKREWRLEPRRVMAQVFVGKVVRRGSVAGREPGDFMSERRGQGLNNMHVFDLRNGNEGEMQAGSESSDQWMDGRDDWSGPPIFGDGRYIDPETIEW